MKKMMNAVEKVSLFTMIKKNLPTLKENDYLEKRNFLCQHLRYEEEIVCVDCGQTILEPICSGCLSKEVLSVVSGASVNRVLKKLAKKNYSVGESCIECGRRNVSFCKECYMQYVMTKLDGKIGKSELSLFREAFE